MLRFRYQLRVSIDAGVTATAVDPPVVLIVAAVVAKRSHWRRLHP